MITDDGKIDQVAAQVFSSEQIVGTLLHIAVLFAILVRIAVPPTLLNLFISYSTEAGAIYEKIHPGSYMILLLLPIALLLRPIRVFVEELPALRALVAFTAGATLTAILLVVLGRAGSAGYFIDTYVVSGAGGLLLYTLPATGRLNIAGAVIGLLALSTLLAIFEAVTHSRVLPYDLAELEFRPTGLSGHPLMLGLLSCSAIGFTWAMPWSARLRVMVIALFLVGTVAAEARFATIMASLTALLIMLLSRWSGFTARQQRRGKLVMLAFVAVAAIPGLFLLQTLGFLSRLNSGLVDESTMARIDIYTIFNYVGLRDIVFGADMAWITRIVNEEIGIEIIESTPVVLIFQLGLPGALAFSALTIFLFWRLCRAVGLPERLSTLAFFATALSNITLSTKTASVLAIVVLLVALQKPWKNAHAGIALRGKVNKTHR